MAKKATKKKVAAKKAAPKKKAAAKKPAKKAAPKKAAAKKPAKKAAAPKKAAKPAKKAAKAPKKKTARKPNAAFMKALTPSGTLAGIIGAGALPRTEAVKKMWGYIKKNGLQDKKNRRMINADAKLKELFAGKGQVSMFDLAKILSKHLK